MDGYNFEQQPGRPSPDAFGSTLAAKQRMQLRALGFYIGGAILLYILLQNLFTLPLSLPALHSKYQTDALFQNGVDILVIMASMLPPFLLLSKPMNRVCGRSVPLPLELPQGGADVLLTIPAGLMFCMAANLLTDLLVTAVSAFGVELSSPDMALPTGTLGILSSVIRVVLMPAVVEELCLRGVVMQNLRGFGGRFAVITSALCFGLMHCNLIQAPFAFTVGLALGYFVLQTGSLWPAILIHALNNSISLVFSYLSDVLPVQTLNLAYTLVQGALFGCGAICFLVYLYRKRENAKLTGDRTALSTRGKYAAFFSAPTMVIAVCAMLYFTSRYVGLS
ncbi:MAG: CPBP family intramembrane metalloprotease [Clostridia bacterium]|nr:CPBP family intramembrane metalloprotease [Clostridia bacterium]